MLLSLNKRTSVHVGIGHRLTINSKFFKWRLKIFRMLCNESKTDGIDKFMVKSVLFFKCVNTILDICSYIQIIIDSA